MTTTSLLEFEILNNRELYFFPHLDFLVTRRQVPHEKSSEADCCTAPSNPPDAHAMFADPNGYPTRHIIEIEIGRRRGCAAVCIVFPASRPYLSRWGVNTGLKGFKFPGTYSSSDMVLQRRTRELQFRQWSITVFIPEVCMIFYLVVPDVINLEVSTTHHT